MTFAESCPCGRDCAGVRNTINYSTKNAMNTPQIGQLLATRRHCYTIPEVQDTAKHGGYVPSLVIEGERGHYPMLGKGNCSSPWVWGKTFAEAQAVCAAYNRDRLKLDEQEVAKIVLSSL